MKILHVANWLGMGGAEKLIADTLPRYKNEGIDVELLLTTNIPTALRNELAKLVTIHTLSYRNFYDVRIILGIIPFMRNYDLIHVHLFPPQYFVALAKLLSGSKTKLVFTEHSTNNRRISNKLSKIPERLIYNQYDKVICITDKVRAVLINHIKINTERLSVISNGVDLENIRSAVPYDVMSIDEKLTKTDILVIQVSSFQEPKDQRTVIDSLQYLPNHVKLILVGDGPLRSECESLVKNCSLENRVVFLGLRNDVPKLLKSASIVILSSKYEGLSLSSIEGMASGRPFIASDVPGLQDVIGGAGVLFPPGDSKKLALTINNLISDPLLYNSIVKSCLRRAEEFAIEKMIEQHISLYESILNKT